MDLPLKLIAIAIVFLFVALAYWSHRRNKKHVAPRIQVPQLDPSRLGPIESDDEQPWSIDKVVLRAPQQTREQSTAR